VELFEKEAYAGGRLNPGSVAKIKYEIKNYKDYLEGEIKRAEQNGNLVFKPSTSCDASGLKAAGYDAIIFALGTKDAVPPLPGLETCPHIQAVELLMHPEKLNNAKKIVVVGGGVVGCEAAYWLCWEKGASVTVVEMDKYIMNHACTANRGHLIHYLEKGGVRLMNCTRVTAFTPNGIEVARNISPTVPDPLITWHPILPENVNNPLEPKLKLEERKETIEADLVVLAMGGSPDDSLYYEAVKEMAAPEIRNIGDSFTGGRVLEAVRAGYRTGLAV
jgi:2-enoate reductase